MDDTCDDSFQVGIDQTPLIRDENRDCMLAFSISPDEDRGPHGWKKHLIFLFIFVILALGIGAGIPIGKYALPQHVQGEMRCEELTTPLFINQSTSYCEDNINGNISLTQATTWIGLSVGATCIINCNRGFELKGNKVVHCIRNGSWSTMLGECKRQVRKSCPDMPALKEGSQSCSDRSVVGSVCTFVCNPGFQLKGSNRTTCLPNTTWSQPNPVCESQPQPQTQPEPQPQTQPQPQPQTQPQTQPTPGSCPKCTCGPTCQLTNQFSKVVEEVPSSPWGKTNVNYAGYQINCHVSKHGGINLKWDCTCSDVLTGYGRRCDDSKHVVNVCSRALANVINDLAKSGTYPEPCDPEVMQPYLPCR